MEYVNFGRTGLKVSRLCLGCMSYGDPAKWLHNWVLKEDESRPFFKTALDKGITFFDTANVYSIGASEEITGRALKDFAKRDQVVIATKVHGQMREDPNGKGLSRKAIMTEIDHSLKRLQTDYVDLYQIHRWDYETPIDETMEALHDVVKAGKARYIGASSMYAWQFAKAQHIAEMNGWTKFVSMQPYYNLIYREEEREMLRLCADQGIAVIPWSPLARGRLTRPWNAEHTKRQEGDNFAKTLYAKTVDIDKPIIERVTELAKKRGVPQAQIALAWILSKPVVTAPIIGATKPHHLNDAVAALSIKLTDTEKKYLEELYVPHEVAGFN